MPTNPDTAKALADLREWVDADNAHADPECACNIIRAYGPTLIAALELAERVAGAPVALMDTRAALGVCALREDDFPALYALQGQRVALLPITDDASSGGGE